MIKKVIAKQRRNGTWKLSIKIPKVTNKIKRAVSLWGIPDNLNEAEAEAIGQALSGMEFEKQPAQNNKQIKMRIRVPRRPWMKPAFKKAAEQIDLDALAALVAEKLKEPTNNDNVKDQVGQDPGFTLE